MNLYKLFGNYGTWKWPASVNRELAMKFKCPPKRFSTVSVTLHGLRLSLDFFPLSCCGRAFHWKTVGQTDILRV